MDISLAKLHTSGFTLAWVLLFFPRGGEGGFHRHLAFRPVHPPTNRNKIHSAAAQVRILSSRCTSPCHWPLNVTKHPNLSFKCILVKLGG